MFEHTNGATLQSVNRAECYTFDCDLRGLPMSRTVPVSDKVRREAKHLAQSSSSWSLFGGLSGMGWDTFMSGMLGWLEAEARRQMTCSIFKDDRRSPDEALEAFELLVRDFVAQPRALDKVRARFRQHVLMGGPTSLHLVGDNGLGKTSLSRMISLALFKTPNLAQGENAGSGLFLVNCLQLRASGSREDPVESILQFVRRNPYSVVLIDDLQYLRDGDSRAVLDGLGVLLSSKQASDRAGNLVDLRGVFFVLTSNTGIQYTREDISDAELDQKVFSLHVNYFPNHQLSDVPNIAALRPLTFAGFGAVSRALFSSFFCFHPIAGLVGPYTPHLLYDDRVPELLALLAWEDGRRLRMGRTIMNHFEEHIIGPLLGSPVFRQRYPLKANETLTIELTEDGQGFEFKIIS
ncbi:MAG: AAA family ATPase [archaeon]|nr:AAA family ATPase [archaeon]